MCCRVLSKWGDISFVLLGGESKSNLTWQNGGFECEEGGASAEEELRLFAQAASQKEGQPWGDHCEDQSVVGCV